MPAADHRLTSLEMARFVADGYLRFDALVPDVVNKRAIDEMRGLMPVKMAQAGLRTPHGELGGRPVTGSKLSSCYLPPSAIGEMLRLPQVRGIVDSLVGSDPLFDHDFVHFLPARGGFRQPLHVDAILDSEDPSFDIQLFYFPHSVEPGEGGTRFVPGSHLRRVRAEGICRYQHLLGDQFFSGPAGSLLVFHHGLWHAGEPNPSERERWMYKIRLNPRVRQRKLWNVEDLESVQNGWEDHVFATMRADTVASELREMPPWVVGHEQRYQLVQRARLWRYLTGDERYDVDYYLTRLEARAQSSATPDE